MKQIRNFFRGRRRSMYRVETESVRWRTVENTEDWFPRERWRTLTEVKGCKHRCSCFEWSVRGRYRGWSQTGPGPCSSADSLPRGGSTVGGYRKSPARRPIRPRLYLDAGRTRGLTTHKNNANGLQIVGTFYSKLRARPDSYRVEENRKSDWRNTPGVLLPTASP